MDHVELLRTKADTGSEPKDLLARVTGRFYTHEFIAHHLINAVLQSWAVPDRTIHIVEPFCGDGRLITLLLEKAAQTKAGRRPWEITLWDCDAPAVKEAEERISQAAKQRGVKARVKSQAGDTFIEAQQHFDGFDLCITNPPWEVVKPDRRELERLEKHEAEEYVRLLRTHDEMLRALYPLSAPTKRFSGWGTNLARCGVEVCCRLLKAGGVAGIVSPASFLADQMFAPLRTWVFSEHCVHDIALYVAEARLFDDVDQSSITFVVGKTAQKGTSPVLNIYSKELKSRSIVLGPKEWSGLAQDGFVIPLQFGIDLVKVFPKLRHFQKFRDLEGADPDSLWAGRELDETGHEKFLANEGKYLFLKGRMVGRYSIVEEPSKYIDSKSGPKIPSSANRFRLGWRDVARPNQKRRMHTTLVQPGWVTGNSLNVAYFRDDNTTRLKALIGVMNSLVFEAQVRTLLATGHISLGAVREVHVPDLRDKDLIEKLASLVEACTAGDATAPNEIEVAVANAYQLTADDFSLIVSSFPKLSEAEKHSLIQEAERELRGRTRAKTTEDQPLKVLIPNHFSASLSELDLMIARAVPPGGNWKDIPESVPSERLKQIRVSYAAGEGSRSTYYGRLKPDAPAYTINTYFSRPGNGCHLHYDYDGGQHRVLSQREAARLQSFPDSFVFVGNRNSVNQQIGNAVPPLLAYQIARCFPFRGQFIDLFSGAGGLGLGFIWAGWTSLVANDIEKSFLKTYAENCHPHAICGDIRDNKVFQALLQAVAEKRNSNQPLFVLGGPPCQGFSTAGNRRSISDERNWLFRQYKEILQCLDPDGFVFENVTGLLNMEGGKVFEMVRSELSAEAKQIDVWKLRAEQYGIPQRRTRVFVVGTRRGKRPSAPEQLTEMPGEPNLFGELSPAISVEAALSDLPPLKPGDDGSMQDYLCAPKSAYQKLMRGLISPDAYIDSLKDPSLFYSTNSSSGART